MTIGDHIEEFGGLKVHAYSSETGITAPEKRAYRLSIPYDAFESGESFADLFAKFTADPACADVRALVIGDWGGTATGDGSAPVVEALASAHDRLPNLRALFLGELTYEESEISWINQSDVSPLFEAFPELEELWLRGGNGLSLGRPQHAKLRKLVIESGGLSGSVIREVAAADLTNLEHLELWLGDDGYGNDVSVEDLTSVLTGNRFPKLRYLGLRDDCAADTTAKLLAEIGVPATVERLDLSLGTLGDDGARALAESSWIKSLKSLDIHHHYVSSKVAEQLKRAVSVLDDSDPKEPDEHHGEQYRYVAVAE